MRVRSGAGAVVRVIVSGMVAVALPWSTVAPAASVTDRPVADLRADVDRDGVVDVAGTTDEAAEDSWSTTRGASYLPNLDDDSRRCPKQAGSLTDEQLQKCTDAADTIVNGAADAADLARLRTLPVPGAGSTATATVTVSGAAAASRTRIFVRSGSAWTLLRSTTKLSAAQVRSGVELGIEALDIMRDPKVWNGEAEVKFGVTDGGRTSSDTVKLKVAPLLTHHALQRAQDVMVTRKNGSDPAAKESQRFARDLGTQVRAAGIKKPLFAFSWTQDPEEPWNNPEDIWAQDFFEPAYATMPGTGGKPVGLRILVRSPQNYHPVGRPSGRQLYERLRGPGVGIVEVPGMTKSEEWTLSSMGNLEKIPPYSLGAKSYPNGRVIMGQRADTGSKPAASLLRLLTAQEGQAPLLLDTSFLRIAHVDEFVHFVPAATPRGWRIAVADPDAAMSLLRAVNRAGAGKQRLTSKPADTSNEPPPVTVAQALADPAFVAGNKLAARKIKANLALLQRETGVTAGEIVRVPTLFRAYGVCEIECDHGAPGGQAEPDKPVGSLSAFLPSAVNGVQLAADRYVAPKQFGPLLNGKDVFATAVTAAYRAAGITVAYVDDWNVYHVGAGNIHCGTNVLRAYN